MRRNHISADFTLAYTCTYLDSLWTLVGVCRCRWWDSAGTFFLAATWNLTLFYSSTILGKIYSGSQSKRGYLKLMITVIADVCTGLYIQTIRKYVYLGVTDSAILLLINLRVSMMCQYIEFVATISQLIHKTIIWDSDNSLIYNIKEY